MSQPLSLSRLHRLLLPVLIGFWLFSCTGRCPSQDLQVATFQIDATPAVGSPLAYDPMREATEALSLRGIVLVPAQQPPIVITAVDWLGVANETQDVFRAALAESVNTSVDRVVIHALHQHDAPRADLSAARILDEYGLAKQHFDVAFIKDCVARAAQAASESLEQLQPVTGVRFGRAAVEQVASNRRMLDPDGKVHTTRYTACRDPKIRALPEGVIDPWLRCLILEGEQESLAVLTFYATHPQSYYRTGQANPDFPGMARNTRQRETGIFHLHLNGAGGNIGAGKYNDGAHENRQVLADRVALGMREAFDTAAASDLSDLTWRSHPVDLPLGLHLQEDPLRASLKDPSVSAAVKLNNAKKLALLKRKQEQHPIRVDCLSLGDQVLLFMPGELFVEYQLAAQAMQPTKNVMVAAYGDYGTGYIGTRVAYPQGGYEVSERASNVAPGAEAVLLAAMRDLLEAPHSRVHASDFTDTIGPLPPASTP